MCLLSFSDVLPSDTGTLLGLLAYLLMEGCLQELTWPIVSPRWHCLKQEVEDVKMFFLIVKVLVMLIHVFTLLCTRFVTVLPNGDWPEISDILQRF